MSNVTMIAQDQGKNIFIGKKDQGDAVVLVAKRGGTNRCVMLNSSTDSKGTQVATNMCTVREGRNNSCVMVASDGGVNILDM